MYTYVFCTLTDQVVYILDVLHVHMFGESSQRINRVSYITILFSPEKSNVPQGINRQTNENRYKIDAHWLEKFNL